MATDPDDKTQARKDPPKYEVGFKRPPVQHRFPPGKSGNPKGRPKGRRNLGTILDDELAARLRVREGGRTRRRTKAEIIIKGQVNGAVQGDNRCLDRVFDLAAKARLLSESPEVSSSGPVTDHDDAIVIEYFKRHMSPEPTNPASHDGPGEQDSNSTKEQKR